MWRATKGRRRGSWVSTPGFLLLWGWLGTGYEMANGQRPSCHHPVLTRVRFRLWGVDWLGHYWFFNGNMSSSALWHPFNWLVPHGCKILSSGISRAEVPGFTNYQRGQEEVRVPNVNVREEWAIHQQSLAKRLLSRVHEVAPKYQMRCPKLSIRVHKNLWPKHEVEISHVHDPDVRLESFPFYDKLKRKPINT